LFNHHQKVEDTDLRLKKQKNPEKQEKQEKLEKQEDMNEKLKLYEI